MKFSHQKSYKFGVALTNRFANFFVLNAVTLSEDNEKIIKNHVCESQLCNNEREN